MIVALVSLCGKSPALFSIFWWPCSILTLNVAATFVKLAMPPPMIRTLPAETHIRCTIRISEMKQLDSGAVVTRFVFTSAEDPPRDKHLILTKLDTATFSGISCAAQLPAVKSIFCRVITVGRNLYVPSLQKMLKSFKLSHRVKL